MPSGHTGGEDGGDHRFHQKLVRSRSLIFTHAATTDADADGQTRVRPDCRRHDIVSSTRFDAAELQVGREQIGEGRRTMGPGRVSRFRLFLRLFFNITLVNEFITFAHPKVISSACLLACFSYLKTCSESRVGRWSMCFIIPPSSSPSLRRRIRHRRS